MPKLDMNTTVKLIKEGQKPSMDTENVGCIGFKSVTIFPRKLHFLVRRCIAST